MNPRASVDSLWFRTKAPRSLALDHPLHIPTCPFPLRIGWVHTKDGNTWKSELEVRQAAASAEARDSWSMGH